MKRLTDTVESIVSATNLANVFSTPAGEMLDVCVKPSWNSIYSISKETTLIQGTAERIASMTEIGSPLTGISSLVDHIDYTRKAISGIPTLSIDVGLNSYQPVLDNPVGLQKAFNYGQYTNLAWGRSVYGDDNRVVVTRKMDVDKKSKSIMSFLSRTDLEIIEESGAKQVHIHFHFSISGNYNILGDGNTLIVNKEQ